MQTRLDDLSSQADGQARGEASRTDAACLDVAQVAANALDAPIALVSMPRADEYRFRANVGLDGYEGVPCRISFCAYTMLGNDLLVVPDARQDARFAQNPLVLGDPHIAAYVGMPLVSSRGATLGTLCVVDRRPRDFSPQQLGQMRRLARIAAWLLEADMEQAPLQEARAALADRERQLRTIADHVPARIAYADRAGHVLYANQPLQAHLPSGDPQARIGAHMRQFVGEERFAMMQPFIERVLRGETVRFESRREERGALRHGEVTLVPDVDPAGRVAGFFGLHYDVTERVRKAQALRDMVGRVRDLAQRLESVREQERRELSHLLHEGVAQDLFSMRLQLERLREAARGQPALADAGAELARSLEHAIADVRGLAGNLLPAGLAHPDVAESIRLHARNVALQTGLEVQVHESGQPPALDADTRALLLRAAQEALANVARHARACRAALTLEGAPEHVLLRVEDDGVGIEAAALARPGALGLLGLGERARAAGGTLRVERNARGGTTLWLRLPLVRSAPAI